MPRGPRIEIADGIHHVWQRGNNKQPIFLNAGDRQLFLRLLEGAVDRHRWIPLAYCLMGNHFHLVLETPICSLGAGMRDLGSRYASLFNERHETGGHLFQARFGSKPVATDEQFAQLLRYVAYNPVKAGYCRAPDNWPWSSHTTLLAQRASPLAVAERVASLLEPFGGEPEQRYARLFAVDGPLQHIPAALSPWDLRPALAEILSVGDLASGVQEARAHGYGLGEITEHLGISRSTLWRRVKQTGYVPA